MSIDEIGGGMTASELAVFRAKNERNARVSARYDALMREGKHGHYETMFKVVREEVEAEREACAKLAQGWLVAFKDRQPEHVSAQKWACDAVQDVADEIRKRSLPSTMGTKP